MTIKTKHEVRPGDIIYVPNRTTRYTGYTERGLLIQVLEDFTVLNLTSFSKVIFSIEKHKELVCENGSRHLSSYLGLQDDYTVIGNIEDLLELSADRYESEHQDD